MGQEVLREARLHEDVLHFLPAHEAVQVGVRLQEDVVVAAALRHGDHPVRRVLPRRKHTLDWARSR